jgi:hypothetical protein
MVEYRVHDPEKGIIDPISLATLKDLITVGVGLQVDGLSGRQSPTQLRRAQGSHVRKANALGGTGTHTLRCLWRGDLNRSHPHPQKQSADASNVRLQVFSDLSGRISLDKLPRCVEGCRASSLLATIGSPTMGGVT